MLNTKRCPFCKEEIEEIGIYCFGQGCRFGDEEHKHCCCGVCGYTYKLPLPDAEKLRKEEVPTEKKKRGGPRKNE